ncbi:MAG: thioesterase family protein [candidate division Zixibacteria bacterium]|nr:thioesterase family protein [candidate division Zixibacteria bacterium]
MYDLDINVRLHETDAAGVLFFGNYFKIAHDAYEQYMQSIGFNFRQIIDEESYLILIVHAEGDFHKPVYVGDSISVSISASKIGRTSFELEYQLTYLDTPQKLSHQIKAKVKTVHVVIDKETKEPIPLPIKLRTGLEKLK